MGWVLDISDILGSVDMDTGGPQSKEDKGGSSCFSEGGSEITMRGTEVRLDSLKLPVAFPDIREDFLLKGIHSKMAIQRHAEIFEGGNLFDNIGGRCRKSVGETPNVGRWWGCEGRGGGWVEGDDFGLVSINFHSALFTPDLTSINHMLELVGV